jgi:hypothetical protein
VSAADDVADVARNCASVLGQRELPRAGTRVANARKEASRLSILEREMTAMAATGTEPQRTEPSTVTTDGLRWWIVGVALGAGVLAGVSLSGDPVAAIPPETEISGAVHPPPLP